MSIEHEHQEPARTLPEYTVGNTVFLVDVAKLELRKKDDEKVVILFDDLEYKGTHFLVWYEDDKTPPAVYRVPPLLELDKEGMAQRYNKPLTAMEGKTDFEVMVDQDFYNERKHGKQPTIQIGDHTYYVDYHWGMLRPHIEFEKAVKRWPTDLAFDDLESVDDDKAYQFFFDTKKQGLFDFDENITLIPPNIFLVTIPSEERMDPFAYARKWGINIEQHLMKNPPQRNFVASLVPAGETFLKDMVNENRQKFKNDDPGGVDNSKQKKKK